MLWNLITDRPSDSHPICPRRGTYLFPESDCINFVLFLTLLEKKTCLADARHTLVAAESQKHFIYVWMAAGAQFCLAQTVCCGLWHLLASLLSPRHTLSPTLLGLCGVLCVCVYVCICMCLELCMYVVCSCLYLLWTTVRIFSTLYITWKRQAAAEPCIYFSYTPLSVLLQKGLPATLIKHERFFRKRFWNWN